MEWEEGESKSEKGFHERIIDPTVMYGFNSWGMKFEERNTQKKMGYFEAPRCLDLSKAFCRESEVRGCVQTLGVPQDEKLEAPIAFGYLKA